MKIDSAIDKIRTKHQQTMQKEIQELQEKCLHIATTDWMSEMWAPGHFTEDKVKVCTNCGIEMGRRKIRKGESLI